MNVTFVGMGMEQLSISLLGAIAKNHGHQVRLAFSSALFQDRYNMNMPFPARIFDDRKRLLDDIVRSEADVLACSVLTSTYHWMLEVAALAKDRIPGLKVVFGGVHPSSCPEEVISRDQVDAICIGEGEEAFPAILALYSEKKKAKVIPNIIFKDDQGNLIRGPVGWRAPDLSALPVFDKSLWEEHINVGALYLTMTSRGCPFFCSFCFNSFYKDLGRSSKTPYVRSRRVDHVMEELTEAKKRYPLRCVTFEDDAFTMDKRWLAEFLGRYKREIGAPFQCMAHSQLMDDEIVRWLAAAGCVWVEMGLQSADEEYKKKHINRVESNKKIGHLIKAFKGAGIKVKCDHIFGMPGEKMGSQEAARKFYAKNTPSRITTYWATYLPATKMVGLGLDVGELSPEDVAAIEKGNFISILHPGGMKADRATVSLLSKYMFLFRLMPVLPKRFRGALALKQIKWLPLFFANNLGFFIDGVSGLIQGNPEHRAYIGQYFRFLKDRIKGKL